MDMHTTDIVFSMKKQTLIQFVVLTMIVACAFTIRMRRIPIESMTGDEVAMGLSCQSVLTRGYPVINQFGTAYERPATTSELIPYLVLPATRLLGNNETGFRFHSTVCGMISIVLVFFLGRRMLGWKTGLLAAAVLAFVPAAIRIDQWARYPSALQMFGLWTTFCIWSYLNEFRRYPKRRYLCGGMIAYICTFASWQGSAFFLVALFAGLVMYHERDLSWLGDKELWAAVIVIALFVLMLMIRRKAITLPFWIIGMGTQRVSLKPLWKYPVFDMLYYIKNFMLVFPVSLSSIGAGGALIWFYHHKAIRFLMILITVPLLFMTCFLEVKGFRYAYYLLPYVILCCSHAVVTTGERIWQAGREAGQGAIANALKLCALVVPAFYILYSNGLVLQATPLPFETLSPEADAREIQIGDNRPVIRYLKNHFRKGDQIISVSPHRDYHYLGVTPDYFLETRLQIPLLLSENLNPVHQLTGSQLIYTWEDIDRIKGETGRIWLITQEGFANVLTSKAFLEKLTGDFQKRTEGINFEGYLWEH
jgi:hypothetical protein